MDKICEMAAVMQQAIQIDENTGQESHELISQLEHENKTLRELLRAAYVNVPRPVTNDEEVQTDLSRLFDNDNQNVVGMDESFTSTDNSFDNPLQRSVIEVFPTTNKTESVEQDENANSSNASSDIDTDNAQETK